MTAPTRPDPARSDSDPPPPPPPPVYEYSDFRAYLKDWYAHEKASGKGLSYRRLAQEMDFKSPGHFSLIVNGKSNLSLRCWTVLALYGTQQEGGGIFPSPGPL